MDRHQTRFAARRRLLKSVGAIAIAGCVPATAFASSAAELDRAADAALKVLFEKNDKARLLAKRARAVLIFPKVAKAGLVIGAQGGEGVLRIDGKSEGYYRIAAISYGLQAGVQAFSYAMFFMSEASLQYLETSKGWQIGTGPSVVVVDQGVAKTLNTTNLTQDVYAMIYGQKGLMAGLGLEGSKITKIQPDR